MTEGNYLLLDEPPWRAVRARLDAVWHVVTDDRRSPAAAGRPARGVRQDPRPTPGAWVERVDQPNAGLVEAARERADLVLDLTRWRG